MDIIRLEGMEFYGYHGCLAEEREKGQRFFVDVSMGLSLRAAGKEDDLDSTIDYAAVYQMVKAVVEEEQKHLIEAVAESIAAKLLAKYPLLFHVTVTVHKPDAPIDGKFRDAAVTITRERRA